VDAPPHDIEEQQCFSGLRFGGDVHERAACEPPVDDRHERIAGPPGEFREVKALRDFVATMDAPTTALHGLTPATRASQVKLYDEALGPLAKAGSAR
jgi:hypothetical protein